MTVQTRTAAQDREDRRRGSLKAASAHHGARARSRDLEVLLDIAKRISGNESLDEVLEADRGHKIFHVAVLQSKHTILAYLCAYATIGRSVFFCEHFYPVAGLAFCATL